jgi:hypothetical protein
MAKIHKTPGEVYEGCAVETLCDGPCRKQYRRGCPAYYKFTYETRRRGPETKLIYKELR